MTVGEFVTIAEDIGMGVGWYHFEGRIPDVTLQCIRYLRRAYPSVGISVEVEKPGRAGLEELAAEADVVFYSKSWAVERGYEDAASCLKAQADVAKRATIGAGDTFIAGILYGLLWRGDDWDMVRKLAFANELASRKICREGFGGLGDTMRTYGFNPP
ncbi:hypothetical protein LTR10_014872 [Elasticomyces elasticus]|uniref:Carbohydrate kinase PfkB domain-containing protein n=1 Tax=Exophiala sideris TaxID=1016849 RepID=A0ABR0JFQ5_9EURO|nr:hypothetical protein LTR10_014872 [Elasticomyces elasticus]KAK5025716.1 hypothetical protein LTS07_007920 [Exophiala sideris]KAK5033075.1 hypothetical protein LTR13_007040 [Exophiala sideris]KAK5063560.1 hypothetical protein LTR69_004266 [Exophiala sideris]KAK5180607.1 hypothetical protein LTR44_006921 [Eurotiomycetes sp. CCFEE 6388]